MKEKSMRVLFINIQDIWLHCNSGGAQCSRRNYELICNYYGPENVHVISFVEGKKTRKELQLQHPEVTFFPKFSNKILALFASLFGCKIYLPWIEKKIIKFIKLYSPQIIFLDTTLLGRLFLKLSSRVQPFKKIVFMHNVEFNYAYNKVKNEGFLYYPSFWASSYNEKIAIAQADLLISLNTRDAIETQKIYERKADILWPITFQDNFDSQKANTSIIKNNELLFVGSNFAPNIHGLRWFVNSIMPYLRDIKLTIVGKGLENYKDELERDNIKVVGTVVDLSAYYYTYPAVIIPICYGDGMKVKTAEAMMYGKIIFSTSEGLEGYDVENINGVYRCDTEKEFINAIQSYFIQPSHEKYQNDIRNLFLQKYETNNLYIETEKILNKL